MPRPNVQRPGSAAWLVYNIAQMGKINKLDFNSTYNSMVRALLGGRGLLGLGGCRKRADRDSVMQAAVGGNFERAGHIEVAILRQAGFRDGQSIVDVGCGSGRLAGPLSRAHKGISYLGIDVVPEFLDHARRLVGDAPGFRFERASGLRIPMPEASADMACFFSLFTHLLHEQSYLYLQEAMRVLRPGGRAVFSFLEFGVDLHWGVFETNIADIGADGMPGQQHLNMFMSRDLIEAWQRHLGFEIVEIRPGDENYVTIDEPMALSDGSAMVGPQGLGQSICIIAKP